MVEQVARSSAETRINEMSLLGKLAKASVRVLITPIVVAVDVVMIIPDACSHDPKRDNFMNRTGCNLNGIADDVESALEEKDII